MLPRERITMARQHFYSRVPARVSLYNKCDGFDTFAKSETLPGDVVMGELAPMYKDKLAVHNPVRIRRGEIPTVYSQARLSDGDIVQTTLKYLPTDFTGERSAYLAHSLILNQQERAAVFYGNTNDVYNPDMFITDVSVFKLTDPAASANPSLADKVYTPRPLMASHGVVKKYSPEMMKGLIYAVAASLCEGGEDVCFRLPVEDSKASDEALVIINAIMSVLPYEMRERLSFASFVSTTEAYKGFKLRCVGEDCAVGRDLIFFDFASETVSRHPAGYEQSLSVASFFYQLIDNRKVRDEFQAFVASISAKYDLRITSMKTLSEIVFIFWQCSGYYVESSILPTDETLISFLDIYEKYREGLTDAQRTRAYRPLARYSTKQIPIPVQIFDRMNNLYVQECVPAKAVALDVALHLIHVDVMRDRLFGFITKNYDRELDSVKAVVNENLARVFYGGFLQQKILNFFDIHFVLEPVKTRDVILDRLLLTIRTPDIQRQIIAFLDRQYDRMNDDQKAKIYDTCLEMIPECDELSALLVGFINRHVNKESNETRTSIGARLLAILERSLKREDSRVAAVFVNENGFCEELTTRFILGQRIGGSIFTGILAGMPAHKRAEKLLNVRQSTSMSDGDYIALLDTFGDMEVNIAPSTVYDILSADSAAEKLLAGEVLDGFRKSIIYPTFKERIFDVFKVKLGKAGVDAVVKYAKGREEILSSYQYGVLTDYVNIVDRCLAGDAGAAFKLVEKLPDIPALRQEMAEHILMCQLDRANQSELVVCCLELAINYLKSGSFRFDTLYPRYRNHFVEIRRDEANFITERLDPPERRAAADAMDLLLGCILEICEVSAILASDVCQKSSGLKKALGDFFAAWGAGARIHLKKHFKDGYEGVVEIMNELVYDRNTSISSFEELFDLLFKRFKR